MIGIVVATHGDFGKALLATLKAILGESEGMTAVALEAAESLETFQARLQKAVAATVGVGGLTINLEA